MKFYPGQEVVYVDDRYDAERRKLFEEFGVVRPKLKARYRVRTYTSRGSQPCLVLHEILNPKVPYTKATDMREAGFAERRFRAVTHDRVKAIIHEALNAPANVQLTDFFDRGGPRETKKKVA